MNDKLQPGEIKRAIWHTLAVIVAAVVLMIAVGASYRHGGLP